MKGYYGTKRLRLDGKAWEVRAKLREMTKRHAPDTTLRQWLDIRAAETAGRVERQGPAAASISPLSRPNGAARSSAVADYRSYPMV
ncbi:Z-ring formation inhibitor MciZ [Paenibacillus sp. TRM 82003]|nr:Z-ring formation inhibitor MciZ [Paenibacillus sp. TRM 82003]